MPNYTVKSYLIGLALSIGVVTGPLLMAQLAKRQLDWYEVGQVALGAFVVSLVKLKEKWDGTERREDDPVTPFVGVADRRKSHQLGPTASVVPLDPGGAQNIVGVVVSPKQGDIIKD